MKVAIGDYESSFSEFADGDGGRSRAGRSRRGDDGGEDGVYVGAPRWRAGALQGRDPAIPAEIRAEHARVGDAAMRRRPAAGGTDTNTKKTKK